MRADEGGLGYPFAQPPGAGEVLEVADGVYWLRMPMPMALDHINLWLLRDQGAQWTIVDCGLATDETRAAWRQLEQTVLRGARVGRVLVTHGHPDHGLADWLCARFQAPLWIAQGEYLIARALMAALPGFDLDSRDAFYRSHGMDEGTLARLRRRGNMYARFAPSAPPSYRRILAGERLGMVGRDWLVIRGIGHSPEHAAFYCRELGVLISGDMLLPRISTHVGVWGSEPEADPLRQFLDSLAAFEALPADTLVLPSHGLPFRGAHQRVAQLRAHHDQVLARTRAACHVPRSAAELVPVLFSRALDAMNASLALGESLAHLNHLCARGELRRLAGPPVRFSSSP
jgi:glyoxylase-like metal-dependent hydrolase (beta-lactamase superfamily II)